MICGGSVEKYHTNCASGNIACYGADDSLLTAPTFCVITIVRGNSSFGIRLRQCNKLRYDARWRWSEVVGFNAKRWEHKKGVRNLRHDPHGVLLGLESRPLDFSACKVSATTHLHYHYSTKFETSGRGTSKYWNRCMCPLSTNNMWPKFFSLREGWIYGVWLPRKSQICRNFETLYIPFCKLQNMKKAWNRFFSQKIVSLT